MPHLYVRLPNCPTDVVPLQLEAEADELWSVMQQKANRQWLWISMDAKACPVKAFHMGDRSHDCAKLLRANIPLVYREQATLHTDQYDAYRGVIPAARHPAIMKKGRKTNQIERFNNALRHHICCLALEILSFSKKLANYIGVIKYCICRDNPTRATALPV